MTGKIYFYLLTLCGIWSQGIIGTFAEEIKESSDSLVREKRVISYVSGEDHATPIRDVPYVVIIRRNNRISCVGSILSHHVVITIPGCVRFTFREYQVVSGTTRKDRGNIHEVRDIKKKFLGYLSRPADGIALLAVTPPFIYGTYTKPIELHSGPLVPGTLGTINGWGFNSGDGEMGVGTNIPKNLRTIEVSVMLHQECVHKYAPHHIQITEQEVCTYHPQRHCGHTDGGAPLVVNRKLVGVHLWTGPGRGMYDCDYPAVFAVLQNVANREWITTNIRNIEAEVQNFRN